jgi:hypothetical protein
MKIARETAAYLRSDRTGEPAVEIVVVRMTPERRTVIAILERRHCFLEGNTNARPDWRT